MKIVWWIVGSLFIILLIISWLMLGTRPAGGDIQQIEISDGVSRTMIANELKSKGVIRSKASFLTALTFAGGKILPGTHTLNPNQSLFVIVGGLVTGKTRYVRVTIPEGWRKEQIARELTAKGLKGDEFLVKAKDKEGYLFPDTYFFEPDSSADALVKMFSDTFEHRTKSLKPTADQLILASIVEREAVNDTERPIIAGIYTNRIKSSMPLQADPTVQYAKDSNALAQGKQVDSFWSEITVADYSQVVSPYNTYLNPGYPPGPIANPGLKSIEAAINPSVTDAYYFFHTGDGQLITSKTHQEHTVNKRKYL